MDAFLISKVLETSKTWVKLYSSEMKLQQFLCSHLPQQTIL